MRDIQVFSGSSHPLLAKEICARLGIPLGRVKLSKFSNKETNVEIGESVRDIDTYIISSGCGNVNDHFIELLIMIAACRTASARKITAVIPCFPYARQPEIPFKRHHSDSRLAPPELEKFNLLVHQSSSVTASPVKASIKNPIDLTTSNDSAALPFVEENSITEVDTIKQLTYRMRTSSTSSMDGTRRLSTISHSHPNIEITALAPQYPSVMPIPVNAAGTNNGYRHWTARSGTLIANMLVAAGADHIITMDLHDAQFQGLFDIPVDNLYFRPILTKYIQEQIPDYENAVVVSPDAGGAKRATVIAEKLKMDFALIHKERRHHPCTDSRDKDVTDVMKLVGDVKGKVDDIADTSYTITRAASILHEHGATRIVALITHGIMSGNAIDRINQSSIDEIIVSNSVPQEQHLERSKKIKVIDVSSYFAEAIRRIHNGESVSFLFDSVPY